MNNLPDPAGSQNLEAPLLAISVRAPQFAATDVRNLLLEKYGVDGELKELVSERDQNLRVTTSSGERYVLKIANAAEDALVTDFQISALLHIQSADFEVRAPEIVRTVDGNVATEIVDGDTRYVVRLVTYLPGIPVSDVPSSIELASSMGGHLAHLDVAFRDFEHAGDRQVLLWDMQRASQLRNLLVHVDEPELLDAVTRCLNDFDNIALPELGKLRSQVIHNDLNPGNALVYPDNHCRVSGIIDFGDMVHGPLIVNVAVAASYLRAEEELLTFIAPFVAAYNRITPLQEVEKTLLYHLIRTRLITTIVILRWRLTDRGEDDAYSREAISSERSAERFFLRLSAMPKEEFDAAIDDACAA